MPIDFTFLLEIFGYIGTTLVIVSMLMTSVVKLRVINICGSTISMIYAILGNTWPIVLLNASLIVINAIQLVRMYRTRVTFHRVAASLSDTNVQYFLSLYDDDIRQYFPEYTVSAEKATEVHIAYIGSEMVGMILGERTGEQMQIALDYATPKYRDLSVSTFLFSALREDGIRELCAEAGVPEHKKYLLRMGFVERGEHMIRSLDTKEKIT